MQNKEKLVLVTGGSGFVGSHCIVQLLQKGYKVRTTIRSLQKQGSVIEMLKNGGIKNLQNISFVEADLSEDRNWEEAVKGCEFVLHIASPIYLKIPKDENEMIGPAVNGTLRVLRAARNAGVTRVVMTSNFGAVGYSHSDKTAAITEASWTDPNEKGLSAYNKSKVLAESEAWKFMDCEGGAMELSVINPVAIFGPALDGKLSSGYELLAKVLDGSMKRIPNITLNIVDVRDLADLHIRAMESEKANDERFLALSDGEMSLPEIASFLKEKLGEKGQSISTKTMPDWIIKLAAPFNVIARNIAPQLGRYRNVSNFKAKDELGWQPRSKEEALLSAAETLFRYGNVKGRK